jgi:PIN domain nuclease of toxin-antitoxin system
MLDTCVVVELLLDTDSMDKYVQAILDDPEYVLYASFETARELVVLFNNGRLRSKHWKSAKDVIDCVINDLEIEFLPLRIHVSYTYSQLQLNMEMNHYDPSDHIIISHAITERIPLLSSDKKFPFYRGQGLELIEY